MTRRQVRELAIVAAFTCLAFLPFVGKAYHIDEPLFLAPARHILGDPLHPLDFEFNWYGRAVPMSEINNTPPLTLYALAAGLKLTGGAELPMRLLFLPFDLLAALSLYLLAARFLSRPLLPTLIVIASPAYLLSMTLLYPEKLMAAFGFLGLWALVKGVDEGSRAWYWISAVLLGGAALAKYAGILFFLPAAGFALQRGVPLRRLAIYLAAASSGLAAYFILDRVLGGGAVGSAWRVTSQASGMPWSDWAHKTRSVLAFAGGGGVVTAAWPLLSPSSLAPSPRRRLLVVGLGAVLILFAPYFDLAPIVRPIDRLTGILFSCGALLGFAGLFAGEACRMKGWALWAPWTLAVLLMLLFLYWSIMARLVAFMIPPLVFAMAERFESDWPARRLNRLYGASLVVVAALSLSLAWVDHRHAAVQKELSRGIAGDYLAQGRTVWCAGHWGLQYYLEKAGARMLDAAVGGWERVRPGDVVIVPKVNSNVLRPKSPVASDVTTVTVDHPLPLRLVSGWTGEGGFYSNVTGFLPYSLSREPVEEFSVVEVR